MLNCLLIYLAVCRTAPLVLAPGQLKDAKLWIIIRACSNIKQSILPHINKFSNFERSPLSSKLLYCNILTAQNDYRSLFYKQTVKKKLLCELYVLVK